MLGKSYCAMLCVPLTVFGVTAHHIFYLCSCGGIGIRVGFRNQIFQVQISAGTPYGHIAQLAEHLTFNQLVVGSSPIISSIAEKGLIVGVLQTRNPETKEQESKGRKCRKTVVGASLGDSNCVRQRTRC